MSVRAAPDNDDSIQTDDDKLNNLDLLREYNQVTLLDYKFSTIFESPVGYANSSGVVVDTFWDTDSYIVNNGFHYMIDLSKMQLHQENVTFEKRLSNGTWVVDNNSPFSFVDGNACIGISGWIGVGRYKYPDSRVKINLQNCVFGYDGNSYDLNFYISNVDMSVRSSVYSPCFVDDGSVGWDNQMYLRAGHVGGNQYVPDTKNRALSFCFDVTIEVPQALDGERMFLVFDDLDQPGIVDDEWAGWRNWSESFYLYHDRGLIDNTLVFKELPGRTSSGILNNTDAHIWYERDGNNVIVGGKHDTSDLWISGCGLFVNAKSATFGWTGTACGTWVGVESANNKYCTLVTRVKYQQKDGTYTSYDGNSFYDEYNKRTYLMGMLAKYGYTWNRKSSDSAVYSLDTKSVGRDGSTPIKDSGVYEITVPRYQYTYSFDFNVPSDRMLTDVQNKQAAFTKYAENLSEGNVKSPSLYGYKFLGWNTKADGSGVAYTGNEKMLSNKTFYAQWERMYYTVHYDKNSSSNPSHETGEFTQNTVAGSMADSVFDFDTTYNLRVNTFSRDGYEFIGWNTKADGSGTLYSDRQSVQNLVPYTDAEITLYAQWRKKLGTETLTVVSEETGNPVSGVSFKLYKFVNGSWVEVPGVGTKTTDSNGKITVSDLHWFNYRWVMTGVPAGYQLSDVNTDFTITYNQLSAANQVILYMKRVEIILDSRVSELISGEAAPTFLYHISGTDVAGVPHEYNLMVQTNASLKFGTNRLTNVLAGNYEITQVPVSRYIAENAMNVSHSVSNGINASVDVKNYDSAEVLFPYSLRQYNGLSHTDSVTNQLDK